MPYRPPHLEGPSRGPIARLFAALVSAAALIVAAVLGAAVFLVAIGVAAVLFLAVWLRVAWLRRRLRDRAGVASGTTSTSRTAAIDGVYRVIDPGSASKHP